MNVFIVAVVVAKRSADADDVTHKVYKVKICANGFSILARFTSPFIRPCSFTLLYA